MPPLPEPIDFESPSEIINRNSQNLSQPIGAANTRGNFFLVNGLSLDSIRNAFRLNSSSCGGCGRPMGNGDESTFSFADGNLWCEDCARQTISRCSNCTNLVRNRDRLCDGDGRVNLCRECVTSTDYSVCERCSLLIDGEENFCDSCQSQQEEEVRIRRQREEELIELRPYDPQLVLIENPQRGEILTSIRPIGVELEVQYKDRKKASKATEKLEGFIGIGTDSSVSGKGLEIRLPPMVGKIAENVITGTCKILKDFDFKTDSSCGMHIHFDMSDIDVLNAKNQLDAIKRLWMTYLAFEDVIISFLPASRRSSRYCKVFRSEYRLDEIYNCRNMNQIEQVWYRVQNMQQITAIKADNNNIVLHHNRKRIFSTTFKKQELPQHSKTAIYARQLQKLLVQFSEIRQEISNKTRACREMTIRSCRVST